MFNDCNKILILAPHADDAELGCGGAIAKFTDEGKDVFCAVFALAKKVGAKDRERASELTKAMITLGVKMDNIISYEYPIRYFSDHSPAIRDAMFNLNRKIKPDIVFVPSPYDLHQDHRIIFQEGIRIFKKTTILSYESPWNHYEILDFAPRKKKFDDQSAFVILKPSHIKKKIKAVSYYRTQSQKNFMNSDFLEGLARVRGMQIGEKFAEAFSVIRIKL